MILKPSTERERELISSFFGGSRVVIQPSGAGTTWAGGSGIWTRLQIVISLFLVLGPGPLGSFTCAGKFPHSLAEIGFGASWWEALWPRGRWYWDGISRGYLDDCVSVCRFFSLYFFVFVFLWFSCSLGFPEPCSGLAPPFPGIGG